MEVVKMRQIDTDECPNCLTSNPVCKNCGIELITEYEAMCDYPSHYCMDCYQKVERGQVH